ncbi:jg1248, partial [Pararge aegeria aegeria]
YIFELWESNPRPWTQKAESIGSQMSIICVMKAAHSSEDSSEVLEADDEPEDVDAEPSLSGSE